MKNRRGLSTMVGAVFFIIAMTVAIAYISSSMNTLDQFAQNIVVKSTLSEERVNEDLKISKATIDGNKFNLTLANEGSVPIHVTRLWVTNQTDNSSFKADLDLYIKPGEQKIKVGQSLNLYANSNSEYGLKVVTARGTSSELLLSNDVDTQVRLIVPAGLFPEQNFTATIIISNNSTNPNGISNLTPDLQVLLGNPIPHGGWNPPSVNFLARGESTVFTRTYEGAAVAETINWNATYVGAPTGSFDTATSHVKILSEAAGASTSEWATKAKQVGVLISGIPNPMNGGNGDWAKFGVGVINPIDRPVEVFAIGISTSATKIFGNGEVNGIEPTKGTWRDEQSTGSSTVLLWEAGSGVGNTVIVNPKEVVQFRVKAQNQESTTAYETPLFVIALTSEGKLTTTYTSSSSGSFPLMNLFYTSDPLDALNDANWGYLLPDRKGGTLTQYNATIENSSDSALASTVKLIILIPKGFSQPVQVAGQTADWDNATIDPNPDGSWRIEVETKGISFNGDTHLVYKYTTTTPVVTEDSMYIFQTVTVYPKWVTPGVQISSAITEAALKVTP